MSDKNSTRRLNKKLVIKLTIGVVLMFGFSYMLVPLYTLICKQAGLNGRTDNRAVVADSNMSVDRSRTIEVEFTATVHGDIPFVFKPLIHHIKVHPGEQKLVYYYAENRTGHDITVQAIPSITPDYAAKNFKKTQCFCFTQQFFFDHEKADMPVYFYIDPHVPKDVKAMTLSYTLYDENHNIKTNQINQTKRIELNS